MSLEKLWVTKGTTPVSQTPGAPALSEDWTTQSESKLADAFDFPRRLLDALQANIQNLRDNGALLWSVDPVFHEAFLSSLRDLANCGLAKPPEGRTLAEALVAEFDGPVQEIVDLLTSQQALLYPNAAAWISRLQGFLSAVEPGTRFPDVPATARLDLLTAYARALEHLYILFAAGSNLAPFFLAEWNTVLKAHPFWIAHQKDIAQRLNDLQLRKRMALGNCGIAWRSLKGDLHNHDELLKTVQDAFGVYFDKRFGGSPDTGYKDYLPSVASKLAPRIGQHTAAFASDFVDKVLLPIEPTPDDPASFNEDLIVQVDRLQRADTSGSSDDQTDLLRRLAGVGVLLRRKDTTDWRCLNLAQLEVTGQALGFDAAPIPVRLGYRNGLRQSYVAYRNQPMAARSPAADLSRMHEMTQGKNGNAPLLRYTNPYSVMGGPRLEALVYGITYDAAVFLLGNAGSLPSEATAKDGSGRTIPWKFKFPSAASPPPFTQQIPYVRRVPVGLVRLGVPKPDKPTDPKPRDPTRNEEMDRLDLPPIPDTVLPITRSLHVRQAEPQKDREDAVLLLTPQDGPWVPNRSQFNFVVRPPSITLDVWDRWTAVDSTSRPKRINVWARYHELTDVPDTVSKASKANIPIDDPAVTQIRFQFTQIYPSSGTPQSVDCAVPATTGDCSNDLKCVQAEAIRVEVFSSNTLTIPTACANPLRIGIPPGQVWKLDILPVIKDTGRFHPKLASSVGRPVTLYIEVASPLLFAKPEDLRATLNAALQLNVKNEQLQISLVPPSANPLWDRIHRIETLLQRWRWDGRPVCYFDWDKKNVPHVHYGFPVAAALTGTLDQFDGTLFGSRQSSDYLSLPSGADFAAPPANSPKLLYQTDLSTLPGALYFRAGIRVFSRY